MSIQVKQTSGFTKLPGNEMVKKKVLKGLDFETGFEERWRF